MTTRLSRPFYILARFVEMFISLGSRIVNAVGYGGSTHQTLSARAYIDGQSSVRWGQRRDFIDILFWFDKEHCKNAWAKEVSDARKTLDRAQASE